MLIYIISIFSYIIGFIFGILYTKYKYNKKTYGVIHVDDTDKECYVNMNTNDILNNNIKIIELKIEHH